MREFTNNLIEEVWKLIHIALHSFNKIKYSLQWNILRGIAKIKTFFLKQELHNIFSVLFFCSPLHLPQTLKSCQITGDAICVHNFFSSFFSSGCIMSIIIDLLMNKALRLIFCRIQLLVGFLSRSNQCLVQLGDLIPKTS